MHTFDPLGELHRQREWESRRREIRYGLFYVSVLVILMSLLLWGAP